MSIYGNVPTATATVGANTNAVTIAGLDLTIVSPGMTINFGARDRKVGDAYLIASVLPTGTNGGSLTLVGSVATAYNSAPFLIDTTGYLGTDSSYAATVSLRLLDTLSKLFGPATNLFAGSRQLVMDKVASTAIGRIAFAIAGRTWGDLAHRQFTYTPTGGQTATVETLALRAFPDGATPSDVLLIDLAGGTGDLRKGSTSMVAAATVDLSSAPAGVVAITGTGTINSFGAGKSLDRLVRFVTGGAVLAHSASLALPTLANITTRAGDWLHAVSDGAGNWRVVDYQRADGTPLISPQVLNGNSGPAIFPAGSTRYFTHALVGENSQGDVWVTLPRKGRLRNLRVVTPGAPGSGQSWTFTVQKLFSDTALTCAVSGTATNEGADLVNVVPFEAGDRFSIKVVSSAGAPARAGFLFTLTYEITD